MSVFVAPSSRLRGTIAPPPDKSISHRAAILATMAVEPVTICNYLDAADTTATLSAMRRLGALIEEHPEHIVVRGTGLREAAPVEGPIDVGNSGTLLRLLPGWLAGQEGRRYTLDGPPTLREREVDRIAVPLAAMGADVTTAAGRPPVVIGGRRLRAAEYVLQLPSAQVKSCVLLAGLIAAGSTSVVEPIVSRDHTERLLCAAGVPVARRGGRVSITNQDELVLHPIEVPGDISSAAYLVAAGLLVPGSRLLVTNTGVNWTRTAFLRIVGRMGGIVLGDLEEPGDEVLPTEPVTDLDVTACPLQGTLVTGQEAHQALDELPLVALLGCWAEGTTAVEGEQGLQRPESHRLERVVSGLRGLGARIEATAHGFVVEGTGGLRGGRFDAHGDRRLATLGAVAGLASRDGVEIVGMDATTTDYPRFLDRLMALA